LPISRSSLKKRAAKTARAGGDCALMKRLLWFPVTALVLPLAMFALLLVSNLYTYHRLVDESPVAELRFSTRGPQQYDATLAWGDFCDPQHFTLYGDQWRMDARFLKWRSWANLLGFDAMYRVERLSGRYRDVVEENVERRVVYSLQPAEAVDLTSIMEKYTGTFSPVDTVYGSSVYDDMDERYVFYVFRGQSGLLVRKVPRKMPATAASGLTIEIDKACAGKPGLLRRTADFTARILQLASPG